MVSITRRTAAKGALLALGCGVLLFVVQPILLLVLELTAGLGDTNAVDGTWAAQTPPEMLGVLPYWNTVAWMCGVTLFTVTLAAYRCLSRGRRLRDVTLLAAIAVVAYLVPPSVEAALDSSTAASAIDNVSVTVLMAFMWAGNAWVALFIALMLGLWMTRPVRLSASPGGVTATLGSRYPTHR